MNKTQYNFLCHRQREWDKHKYTSKEPDGRGGWIYYYGDEHKNYGYDQAARQNLVNDGKNRQARAIGNRHQNVSAYDLDQRERSIEAGKNRMNDEKTKKIKKDFKNKIEEMKINRRKDFESEMENKGVKREVHKTENKRKDFESEMENRGVKREVHKTENEDKNKTDQYAKKIIGRFAEGLKNRKDMRDKFEDAKKNAKSFNEIAEAYELHPKAIDIRKDMDKAMNGDYKDIKKILLKNAKHLSASELNDIVRRSKATTDETELESYAQTLFVGNHSKAYIETALMYAYAKGYAKELYSQYNKGHVNTQGSGYEHVQKDVNRSFSQKNKLKRKLAKGKKGE